MQQFHQRLALYLAASRDDMRAYTSEVTQTYIKNATELERDVFIRPLKELDIPLGHVMQGGKLLQGIPESGFHWYIPYLSHHLQVLGIKRANAAHAYWCRLRRLEWSGGYCYKCTAPWVWGRNLSCLLKKKREKCFATRKGYPSPPRVRC